MGAKAAHKMLMKLTAGIKFINIFFLKYLFLVDPFVSLYFFLFCYNDPELGAGINPGMALTSFCFILDETRFEPTTFQSCVNFTNH